jgi:DNA-binding MurR/RpiR family transcriptional regulator
VQYTAGEAAKAAGVSTATITRAIKTGKIAAHKSAKGAWKIEPAELHRVYPPVAAQDPAQEQLQSDATPMQDKGLHAELEVLREKVRSAEALQAAAESDRDAWRAQAERLSKALPSPEDPPQRPRRWRWPWQ